MSTNGHLPEGYYVLRQESGTKVLYSPYKIPKVDTKIGGYFEGTEPRPVCSWTKTVSKARIAEVARLDAISRQDDKPHMRRAAKRELAEIFQEAKL